MTDGTHSSNGDKHKVLVVDDDADMRTLIGTVLETVWDNMEVVEFDPMDESATPIFDWAQYDLLLLDYQLGNGSGLDWLRQYRDRDDFPATILITGVGSEDVAVKALKLGAEDYLRKGEGFRERLITAVHEFLEHEQEVEEDHSDWGIYLKKLARLIATPGDGLAAMFSVELDQLPNVKASQGLHVADHILATLHRLVEDRVKTGGARLIAEIKDGSSVSAFVHGLESVSDVEAVAMEVCQQVRQVRFDAAEHPLSGTASIGVCLVDASVLEIANLIARAEAACQTAKLRGGDQSYLGSLRGEIGEAVSSHDTATGGVWRHDEEVNAIITESRLRTHFEHVRRLGEVGEPLFYRAVPVISQRDGSVLDDAGFARFLASPGRRTFLDRITLNQALRKLEQGKVNPEASVFMRLSGESVVMTAFWDWLQEKLADSGLGARFVFEVAYADVQDHRLPGEVLSRLNETTSSHFAFHGFTDTHAMLTAAKALGIRFLVLDLGARLASQSCDKVSSLVRYAHGQGVRVVLNKVDDSYKFACAYESGADLLQGSMTAQWAEVDLDETQQVRTPWA